MSNRHYVGGENFLMYFMHQWRSSAFHAYSTFERVDDKWWWLEMVTPLSNMPKKSQKLERDHLTSHSLEISIMQRLSVIPIQSSKLVKKNKLICSVRVKRQWGPWDYYGYDTYRPRGYWGRRWRRRFRWRSQFYDPYGWRKWRKTGK